jgi:ABC-2 type transport system ATP-binding protein
MRHAVETFDLSRRYGSVDAVDGLTLHVPAGSVFALLGANGAGKTTTIKLLMNLVQPTRGSATLLGVDSRRLASAGFERIGYVSEHQRLPDHLTAAALLAYCRPFYPTWDDRLCHELADQLRLPMDAPLRTMSRGTRMKAALLSSLVFRPDLLVLDEPFSGLDPLVRDELIHALLAFTAEHAATVFVSSHDIEEVERLADWIGFLDRGRIVVSEQITSLLDRFRLVEVVGAHRAPQPVAGPAWLGQEIAGRTLRFVDSYHREPQTRDRIAAAYPDCEVRTSPLPLRDIFVVLAKQGATQGRQGVLPS